MSRVKLTLLVGFLLQISPVFANIADLQLLGGESDQDLNVLHSRFQESYQSLLTLLTLFSKVIVTIDSMESDNRKLAALFESEDAELIKYTQRTDRTGQNVNSELYSKLDETVTRLKDRFDTFCLQGVISLYASLKETSRELARHIMIEIDKMSDIWVNEQVQPRIREDFIAEANKLETLRTLFLTEKKVLESKEVVIDGSVVVSLLGEEFVRDLEPDDAALISVAKLLKTGVPLKNTIHSNQ